MPRQVGRRFIERRGLGGGFIRVHWRTERDKMWMARGVNSTAASFIAKIARALAKHGLSKVFLAVDFEAGRSTSFEPLRDDQAEMKRAQLVEIIAKLTAKFGELVRFDPAVDFPQATAANNSMLIAGTEASVLIQAASSSLCVASPGLGVRLSR